MSTSRIFQDLHLQFATEFELRWRDEGSGAHDKGGFWHPKPPPGFSALGSIGISHYGNPNNPDSIVAALCVKDTGHNALQAPESYNKIWTDEGSGADRNGSCWRPVPPSGYVALGDVFVSGYGQPDKNDVVCVREDLVYRGVVGPKIWDDEDSGADEDFSAWHILTSSDYIDPAKGLIAPGTFVGTKGHGMPRDTVYCLCLILPTTSIPKESEPKPPVLESSSEPPDATIAIKDRTVTVPCTAVVDSDRDLDWRIRNSPFYDIARSVSYKRAIFNENRTNTPQEQNVVIVVGVEETQSKTFSVTTGISVTAEAGVKPLGVGGNVSATVSVELGWSTSTSVTEFRQKEVHKNLVTPANYSAVLYELSYSLQVMRADGTSYATPLEVPSESFSQSQFPIG